MHGEEISVMTTKTPVVAMTIAGTDSGGSAGIAADLKTFASHHVHGTFAATVVTAQNTTGIASVHPIPPDMVAAQLDAILGDFSVRATKTGLLYTTEVLEGVAERVDQLGALVVDPVLVTSSGEPMLDDVMPELYRDRLFPHAVAVTPNVAEASLLTGIDVVDRESAMEAAVALCELGPQLAVITGLLEENFSVDTIATATGVTIREQQRIDTANVLGTGCSLSSAMTALIAKGTSVEASVGPAATFVHEGLRSSASWRLGAGRGPIDHFVDPSTPRKGRTDG